MRARYDASLFLPLRSDQARRWPILGPLILLLATWSVVAQDDAPPPQKIVRASIEGEINLATSAFVKRVIEEADAVGADTLLFELETFGGRVDAAVAIRDALLDADQRSVMYIDKRAISAGALMSLACNTVAIAPGGTIGAATPISSSPGQEVPAAVEEKYLSYFREEMRSTAETRGRNGDIAVAMVDAEVEVEGISEKGKLLTLNTRTAVEHGIADFEAKDLDAVLAAIGASDAEVVDVEHSWAENLAAFLTSAPIASLLVFGMMLFGYLELQTPGFGLFGGIAATCFIILYFSHYLVNLAGHEELALFGLGVILFALEVFVIPGFGVFAALAAACILASAVMLLMAGDWTDLTFENPFTLEAALLVSYSLAASVLGALVLGRFVISDRFRAVGGLTLGAPLSTDRGYTSYDEQPEDQALLGEQGTALTTLRPSGKARIAGRRVNVETEGDWIERGAAVEIVRKVEGRLVVRAIAVDEPEEAVATADPAADRATAETVADGPSNDQETGHE
ncbi:MAG: NfeD family protein [Acidobacteriota bacterium]